MSDLRKIISWLLLAMLAVVGGGAAVLGASQAPKSAGLKQAAVNTLAAPNFSEVLSEVVPQGTQSLYIVFQSPDRLGGYVQNGNKRSYVVIIGHSLYRSLTVAATASTKHLTFYRQSSLGAAANDPAHTYLPFAIKATHVTQSGNTYTFDLHQGGQTQSLKYIVSGQYVSEFGAVVPGGTIQLIISQVGTSPSVSLPAGAKVVGLPTTGFGPG